MVKQADSGILSILAAVAAAIAPVVVKALIARRRRAPLKAEEQIMCRNHSHVTGRVFSLTETDDFTMVKMLVTQPLTLEASNGARLTLPQYTVLYARVDQPPASLGSELLEMAGQGVAVLPREGLPYTSGHITPPK